MSDRISLDDIKTYLTKHGFPEKVDAAVVLGSGLGDFSARIDHAQEVHYADIPGFPVSTVEGHAGSLISGTVRNKRVIAFSGRFHHYEGHPFSQTVLPVRMAKHFGAHILILSNAAGAVNPKLNVGDLMVIDDIFRFFHYINTGRSEPFRYNHYETAERVRKIASAIGLDIQRGTYLYTKGPNYETKAEIRAFQRLGVDVVGMSTAPELQEASQIGLKAAAISLVTNMAAGLGKNKLDHAEVKEAAQMKKAEFADLVTELIEKL